MASQKISQLTLASISNDTDVHVIVQNGETKQIPKSLIFDSVNTSIGTMQTTLGGLQTDLSNIPTNMLLSDGTIDMDAGYAPLNPLSIATKEYSDLNINNIKKFISVGAIPVPLTTTTFSSSPNTTLTFSGGSSSPIHDTYYYTYGTPYGNSIYTTVSGFSKTTGAWTENILPNIPSTGMVAGTDYTTDIFQTNNGDIYCAAGRVLGGATTVEVVFHKFNTGTQTWDLYWQTGVGHTSSTSWGEHWEGSYDWQYEESTGGQYYGLVNQYSDKFGLKTFDLVNKLVLQYSGHEASSVSFMSGFTLSNGLYIMFDSSEQLWVGNYITQAQINSGSLVSGWWNSIGHKSAMTVRDGILYLAISYWIQSKYALLAINPLNGVILMDSVASTSVLPSTYMEVPDIAQASDGTLVMIASSSGSYGRNVYALKHTGTGALHPIRYELDDRINSSDIEGHKAVNLCYDEGSDVSGALSENSFVAGASNLTSLTVKGASSLGRYSSQVDAIFTVGNGADTNTRSNALEVYENGTATLPGATIAEIDAKGNSAIITKEYFDTAIGTINATLDAINGIVI